MVYAFAIAFFWYFLLWLLGLIVLPLSMHVFRRMPEHGILLSRPLGWLLLTYLSWVLGVLGWPFTGWGIALLGLALFGFSLYVAKQKTAWLWQRIQRHWRTALNGELIAILVFVLILVVRFKDPNIDHTEKPMDAMMLNSLVASTQIPPQDAWFAGYPINYHYGGYLFYSIPLKVFGVPPEMGYNLVIPTVVALAASIAFCLGRALWGRCRLAGISVLFILFVGNLAAFFEIFNGKTIATDLFSWRWGYLWKTSRVIRDAGGETINEYPFFSILWGDIHPHFSNIPFVLLFMVIAFALYQAIVRLRFRDLYRLEWPLLATAVVSGALLFPTNVFDFPVFSLFLGAVVLAGAGQSFVRNQKAGLDTLSKAGLALLPLGSYLLAFPFWFYFESPLGESPLRWVEVRSTSLDMILVFGAHLVGSLVFLFLHRSVQIPAPTKEDVLLTLSGYGLIVVALWVWTGAVMAALLPVIALLFWLTAARAAWSTEESYLPQPVLIFAAIACALGWSLIAGCEYIYLKDNYGVARMNTLFKFHFPAWILLGAGLPPLVYFAFKQQKNASIRSFVGLPLALVVLMALAGPLYCLQGIYTMPATQTGNTLNGIAFLQKSNPLAFEIIHWLRENSRPGDRILEPAGSAYQLENLFSTHTGRATIVGWVNHEHLWRPQQLRYNDGSTEGVRRQQDSFRFFTTPNWDEAKAILKKYEIRYVAFMPPINAEIRNRLAGTAQAAYRAHLEPVFKGIGNGQSPELYRVPETLD